ncbi:hypothetical protein PR048_014838 [Dryococelus australis]|uniref:Uncharacterized protein n=1 Tax=Dryococelus australis TaxID=614101 RepID=A0ABQ9HFG2_9NEOP|nr:hypothetical protein PR048_014838 [Dryococelus australis]
MRVKRGEYGTAPKYSGGGNGRYSRKSADQRHRKTRFPHAKIRERTRRESYPVLLEFKLRCTRLTEKEGGSGLCGFGSTARVQRPPWQCKLSEKRTLSWRVGGHCPRRALGCCALWVIFWTGAGVQPGVTRRLLAGFRHVSSSSSLPLHRHDTGSLEFTGLRSVVAAILVNRHLLSSVHTRRTQQEPVTIVEPRETGCTAATQERAARHPVHECFGVNCITTLKWPMCKLVNSQFICVLLASHQGDPGSIPGQVTPDFRIWESCRTVPFVGGFSRGSPVSPPFHSGAAPYSYQSRSSALKTPMATHTAALSIFIRVLISILPSRKCERSSSSRRDATRIRLPGGFYCAMLLAAVWSVLCVSWDRVGIQRRGKREIPKKTRRPAASSGTIPTCGNPVTRQGIEPGSPWWEASSLTAHPP